MPKKAVKSISMDDSFYKKISRHARKQHMSTSGWLAAAAEEKLERERVADEPGATENALKKKK